MLKLSGYVSMVSLYALCVGCVSVAGKTENNDPADPPGSNDPADPPGSTVEPPSMMVQSAFVWDNASGVDNTESNPNNQLDKGETTAPNCKFSGQIKPVCPGPIYVIWTACLKEKVGDSPILEYSVDVTKINKICGTFKTTIACNNQRLSQSTTTCINGSIQDKYKNKYCNFTLPDTVSKPMTCGWVVENFTAYTAVDNKPFELTPEELKKLGYTLLPVEMTP